jgi:hypothetical protein
MNRYIIALSCKDSRGGWEDMVKQSGMLTRAGFPTKPNRFFSRDSYELHWLVECTEVQLTMLILKTSAKLLHQLEDPWASKSNIPF